MSVLTNALIVADFGHAVFPVVPGGKRPLHKGWQGEATTDPARIRALLSDRNVNYGIRTEQFAVLDFDRRDLAEAFYKKHRGSVTTIVTTPHSGIHFWFANDGIRNSQNDGWDVRGKGGFVVGIGSVVNGVEYRIVAPLVPVIELKPFPVDYLSKRIETRSKEIETDVLRRIARARAYAATVRCIAGQRAHNALFRLVCWLRDIGLTEGEAFAVLSEWNQANALREDGVTPYPWTNQQISHKIGDSYGKHSV